MDKVFWQNVPMTEGFQRPPNGYFFLTVEDDKKNFCTFFLKYLDMSQWQWCHSVDICKLILQIRTDNPHDMVWRCLWNNGYRCRKWTW